MLASLMSTFALTGGLAPVATASGNPVLQQCASGSLDHRYSIAQLRQALALLTAAEKQYTSCQDVIQRAIVTAAGNRGNGPAPRPSSGFFLPTPVVVILVCLALGAVLFGALAVRRRRDGQIPDS